MGAIQSCLKRFYNHASTTSSLGEKPQYATGLYHTGWNLNFKLVVTLIQNVSQGRLDSSQVPETGQRRVLK